MIVQPLNTYGHVSNGHLVNDDSSVFVCDFYDGNLKKVSIKKTKRDIKFNIPRSKNGLIEAEVMNMSDPLPESVNVNLMYRSFTVNRKYSAFHIHFELGDPSTQLLVVGKHKGYPKFNGTDSDYDFLQLVPRNFTYMSSK